MKTTDVSLGNFTQTKKVSELVAGIWRLVVVVLEVVCGEILPMRANPLSTSSEWRG